MKGKILGALVAAFIAIQLVPFGRNHSNPATNIEPKWDSPQTRETFFRVCGDCHSNKTVWPWYSNIAPVSWLVQRDVNEAREKFNATNWGGQKENEGEEAKDEVAEGEMPLWSYVLMHPKAKLSAAEKQAFIKGLASTFAEEKSDNKSGVHKDDDDDD